jgi:hypothetical protein
VLTSSRSLGVHFRAARAQIAQSVSDALFSILTLWEGQETWVEGPRFEADRIMASVKNLGLPHSPIIPNLGVRRPVYLADVAYLQAGNNQGRFVVQYLVINET